MNKFAQSIGSIGYRFNIANLCNSAIFSEGEYTEVSNKKKPFAQDYNILSLSKK